MTDSPIDSPETPAYTRCGTMVPGGTAGCWRLFRIADVHGAASADEHAERVHRWARSVWEAWSTYHEWAREWLRGIGLAHPRGG